MKIELLGGYTKEELDLRIKRIATAGKLSRYPGNVFEVLETCNDTEKNIRLIKRIIGMGHKSIIEHDYLVFALCDVTPIVEQTIIGNRLTSFTIKSRREVDFRNVGFYIPNFRDKNMKIHKDNEILKEKYIKHMKYLFNTYGNIVDLGINIEDARFILPYSYHSNIIMGLDVRELEKLIVSLVSGTLSNITDLKDFGNELLSITKQFVPYLEESIDKELQKTTIKKPFEYLENLYSIPKIKIIDKPKMISYTSNPDDVILKSSIMYHYQCDEETANEIFSQCIKKDKFWFRMKKDFWGIQTRMCCCMPLWTRCWEPRPWEISGSIFRIQIRPIKGFQASGFWSMWESSSKKRATRWGISTRPSSPRGRRWRLISRLCVRTWPELLE